MNNNFYKDLDTNFEQACLMSETEFSHEELLEMLKNGNIPQKQIAAMKIEKVNNKEESKILINNLTGCDGKIREAVALKINQLFIQNANQIHFFTDFPEIFAKSTIDINANICRLIAESVSKLIANDIFAKGYCEKILCYINETFSDLDKIIYKDKKYTINKQLFKLYWCLEALKLFANKIPDDKLLFILNRASKEKEYTIREKIAQIVVNIKSEKFAELRRKLAQDENYYVREVFKHKND